MIELEQVRARLEELGMQQGAVLLDVCLERATREQPTYIGFLSSIPRDSVATATEFGSAHQACPSTLP